MYNHIDWLRQWQKLPEIREEILKMDLVVDAIVRASDEHWRGTFNPAQRRHRMSWLSWWVEESDTAADCR